MPGQNTSQYGWHPELLQAIQRQKEMQRKQEGISKERGIEEAAASGTKLLCSMFTKHTNE